MKTAVEKPNGTSAECNAGVSVIIPHRNHAAFIGAALEAISSQSCPPRETIVVDDRSDREQANRLREICAGFDRVRLILLKEWVGVNAAVQAGLPEASGDFVYLASADDLIAPDFLQSAVSALSAHPDAAFAFSEPAEVSLDGRKTTRFSLGLAPHDASPLHLSPELLEKALRVCAFTFSTNTIVYRRERLLAAGGFEPTLRWHADWTAAHVCALKWGCVFIPRHLAFNRVNRESYSRRALAASDNRAETIEAVLQHLSSHHPDVFKALGRVGVLPEYDMATLRLLTREPGRDLLSLRLVWRTLGRSVWRQVRAVVPPSLRRRYRSMRFGGLARP